jgi:hypothetical protein
VALGEDPSRMAGCRSRQLDHGNPLPFGWRSQQNDLAIRQFERIVMAKRLVFIHASEPATLAPLSASAVIPDRGLRISISAFDRYDLIFAAAISGACRCAFIWVYLIFRIDQVRSVTSFAIGPCAAASNASGVSTRSIISHI